MARAKPVILAGVFLSCLSVCVSAGDAATHALVAKVVEGAKTDAERAVRLLEAAKLAGDDVKTQVLLLESSVDYGLRGAQDPDGFKAAEEAIALLREKDAARAAQWGDKRLELHRLRYRRTNAEEKKDACKPLIDLLLEASTSAEQKGDLDAVIAFGKEAAHVASEQKLPEEPVIAHGWVRQAHLKKCHERVEQYRNALKARPQDGALRMTLLKLQVIDLNRPREAIQDVGRDTPHRWRVNVPLAAEPVDKMNKDICKTLAGWYYDELSNNAGIVVFSQVLMLNRAKAYYERFLALHNRQDAESLEVHLTVKKIDEELERLRVKPRPVEVKPPPPPELSKEEQERQRKLLEEQKRKAAEEAALRRWRWRRPQKPDTRQPERPPTQEPPPRQRRGG